MAWPKWITQITFSQPLQWSGVHVRAGVLKPGGQGKGKPDEG